MSKKKYISIIALFFSLSLLVGCKGKKEDSLYYVHVFECDNQKIEKNINVKGIVENDDTGIYMISSKLSDYCVKTVNVHTGDEVRKGDVICELDSSDIEKNIQLVEERLRYSEENDEQNIDGYKKKISKINELLKIKLSQIEENRNTDQKEYDEIEQMYNNAKTDLENAEKEYSESINLNYSSSIIAK